MQPSARRAVRDGLTAKRLVGVATVGTVVGFMTGFFGVGGGFVVVPGLVLALGFGMPEAVGTSLLVIALNSVVALAARGSVTALDWHVVVPFTAAAMAGSVVGGWPCRQGADVRAGASFRRPARARFGLHGDQEHSRLV